VQRGAPTPVDADAHVYPIIGKVVIDAITTDDVIKILSPIWNKKNETAARLRGRIEKILDAERCA
jgi:hypothetical protein